MDYKEKYEMALAKCKTYIDDTQKRWSEEFCKATEEVFFEIFPELKESEDERIREAQLDYWRSVGGKEWHGVPVQETIAWLEKQGEKPKKVSIWKHWKDGIAGNGEGKQIYLIKAGNTYNLSSCLCFECDYIELSELDNLLVEKQAPNPKWTEEDEKN